MAEPLGCTIVASPVGPLTLVASAHGIREIRFGRTGAPTRAVAAAAHIQALKRQLQEYFAGHRRSFDVPLDWQGTPFQQSVWRALLRIPYGKTASYADVARAVGKPRAFRAVGGANRANPLPIVVPCHRVIGSDGSLTGYSGLGRLPIKAQLLKLESR